MDNFFKSLKFRLILLLLFTFVVFASIKLQQKGVFAHKIYDLIANCHTSCAVCHIHDKISSDTYMQYAQKQSELPQQN